MTRFGLFFSRPLPGILTSSVWLAAFAACVPVPGGQLPGAAPLSSPDDYLPPAAVYDHYRAVHPEPAAVHNKEASFYDGQVLTLGQCLRIALARTPEIREARQRVSSAAAGLGLARSAYLPTVDVSAGGRRSKSVSLDSDRDIGPENTFSAAFGLRYLLFDGGARRAALKGAEAELLYADFQHNVTLQDVALKVEEAYYQLLAARQLERVAEQTFKQTQYQLDVARARHKNGLAARSDVLKAGTEKADAELQLVRARSQTRIARGRLANAMGLKPSESFKAAELPPHFHQREMADVKRLMAEAAAYRPELGAVLAKVESAREKVEAGRARYRPRITLDSDYGLLDHSIMPDRDEWSLGIGITWPLFDGFDREYTVRRAGAELAGSVAAREKLLRGVELEVWTAYSRLIEADQAIEAARALVASAGESARVTEGEYKNGTASIIEVTDAQTASTTANVHLVRARLDWYTAMAQLERAVGRTLAGETPEPLKELNP